MPLTSGRRSAGVGYRGPVPEEVWEVLRAAYTSGISVSSNYARSSAAFVAFAASMGWVSTITPEGLAYSREWHITAQGLYALGHQDIFA